MDRVVVVDPDPMWPSHFRAISDVLAPTLGTTALRIEHVGSTSVPGLAAKPIIDIDVVVRSEERILTVIGQIASAGYRWLGDLGVTGREAFEAVSSDHPAHHLYAVVENNRAHCDHWLFRDELIERQDLRERYSTLKRENAVLAGADIDRYVALKAAFVAEVLSEARRRRAMAPVTYWEPDLS